MDDHSIVSKLKRKLVALESRDMTSMGYEARIRHGKRIEQCRAKLAQTNARADDAADRPHDQPVRPAHDTSTRNHPSM